MTNPNDKSVHLSVCIRSRLEGAHTRLIDYLPSFTLEKIGSITYLQAIVLIIQTMRAM